MADTGYINNQVLKYQSKNVESSIRSAKNETPGKYGSSIDTFKEGGLDITIDTLARSITERDNIIAAFMEEGRNTYYPGGVDVGWHYTGKCTDRSSSLKLTKDKPSKAYPLSFLFTTDIPFLLSDVLHSRGFYVTSSGEEITTDNCFPGNLIKNFDFENWTNGTTNTPPDNWYFSTADGPCINITRSATHKTGSYSCALTFDGSITGPANYIMQYIPCKSNTEYTIGIWIKITGLTQGQAQFRLRNSTAVLDEIIINSNCDWTFHTFDYEFTTLDPNVYVDFYGYHPSGVNAGAVFYLDSVVLTEKNNYELSTFGNDISTIGTVSTIPDIEVAAAYIGATGPAAGASYTKNDNGDTWSTAQTSYQLNYTITISAVSGVSHRIDKASCKQWTNSSSKAAWVKITLTNSGYNGGSETTIMEYSTTVLEASKISRDSVTYGTAAITCAENSTATLKIYVQATSGGISYAKYFSVDYTEMGGTATSPSNVSIYNSDNTLTKLDMGTFIPGSKKRVNWDDTGEYTYLDDYSDESFRSIATVSGTITWSNTSKNITIANTAYLIYPFDLKFPVTGIPTLSLYINSGRALVYIAVDNGGNPGTFYEVDNDPTSSITNDAYVYSLNNAANLQLAGSTKFYVKIIPYTGTSSVVSAIQLYSYMCTVDAERPLINKSASNTFKIDMDDDTALFLSMYWNDRKWGT